MSERQGQGDELDWLTKRLRPMAYARNIVDKRGRDYVLFCPNCGGKAYGHKSAYNGHIRVRCKTCQIRAFQ